MTPTEVPSGEISTDAAVAASAAGGDERLAYRSVFQRLFVRPEVGGLIGAAGIWIFFWAASGTFGTVGQTFTWLDTAATLGIMAVAVSMLMIGGEFDLSSGAMTGAMGMLIIYLVKETGELGGLGFPMLLAIPLSLLVALGIGYLNGFMVERTGQPSFIITLGTFFALIGLKLGLSKRFVGQIQIGRTDEASDFDFFRPIFAAEWARNEHPFELRDLFYISIFAAGVIIVLLAICELWFQRAEERKSSGLIEFIVGLGLGIAAAIALHLTDGVGVNAAIAVVMAVAVFLGMHGWVSWRYEPIEDRGAVILDEKMRKFLGLGFGLVVLGAVIAVLIDSSSTHEFFFPFTTQGIRVILLLAFVTAGMALIAMASQAALSASPATKGAVTSVLALAVAVIAALTFIDSEAAKFRASLFSVLLFAAVVVFVWGFVVSRFVERRVKSASADHLGGRMLIFGIVSIFVGLAFRMLFITEAELLAEVPPAKTSIRLFWFVAFTATMMWVLARTRFGSWTVAVGGNKEAARQVGVPAARTKTQLFMLVSVAAWFVGLLVAFRINSIQSNAGDGQEFFFIIAAVVGGTLLTGGYGTAFGGAIGACIMSMPLAGISAARWNTDWRFLIIGVILLLAVVSNKYLRNRAEAIRR
ncbi:ABC transporter permease [uncultured Ilumatobacter sp.]|uniref:ABC transporter permease n=1 Tax=uncultured Ilumatobacter sp. TaxID=879968 RepID=UPI00374FD2A7